MSAFNKFPLGQPAFVTHVLDRAAHLRTNDEKLYALETHRDARAYVVYRDSLLVKQEEGGWKRECPSCKAEHFPRTDPVVIMLVTHGDRCLLGRQKQFLPGMYSCLAGFVEAAETIEDAVRREIFEESGIRCTDVNYYMTQPWPYPSSLMIGCTARATTEDIVVDRAELEDARWFSRAEATLMHRREHPDGLFAAHPFAIAHHLIGRWLHEGSNAGA